MKTVFYGGSKYVLPILEILDLKLIVTTEKNPLDPVISYAINHDIPYISARNLNDLDIKKKLKENLTKTAVLADFGLIIPSEILSIYPGGIINIHPSLLPKYRGPTPVQSTILNGDLHTGVTVIKLDNEVDHGPVIAQTDLTLNEDDTAETAYLKLFTKGAALLSKNYEKYLKGEIVPQEQDHKKATFTQKLTRQSGFFHIENPPPVENLRRMIRAYYPWPGVWTRMQMANSKWLIVKFLPGNKLQVEGKRPVSLKDFYNGYPELKSTIQKLRT